MDKAQKELVKTYYRARNNAAIADDVRFRFYDHEIKDEFIKTHFRN